MKIKRGDIVEVIRGSEARKTADKPIVPRKVLHVVDDGKKVVVEGVNRVYKHIKRGHPKSPQGGRLSIEMPIDISNVLLYCDSCARGTRVGYKFRDDGSKVRVCRKCKKELDVVSPANPKYAKK